jgi:cyclopropane-fatty-acyl-phospholipid synthase
MELDQDRVATPRTDAASRLLRLLLEHVARVRHGRLTVHLAGHGEHTAIGPLPGPDATIEVQHPLRLARRVFRRGDVGFAESFMAGEWRTPQLEELLEVLALNEERFGAAAVGGFVARWVNRLRHLRRPNTTHGSRRNIAYHYDLGNDFYRLWLDESMTYSAGLFERNGDTLEAAQRRKYHRLIDAIGARPGDHVLEIGCGWGGFAEEAAKRGLRVTGITLSRQQLDYARRRIQRAGLDHRVDLQLRDYRSMDGSYDHIVSIEMFEAVGEAWWPTYFQTLARCLRPGGRAGLQVITIDSEHFEAYRRQPDFIQLYIFPGGMLPTRQHLEAKARSAGLVVADQHFFGVDYARTLNRWHARVIAAQDAIRAMGFEERFLRMWRYYLAYCEAGFRTGRIDVTQTVLTAAA